MSETDSKQNPSNTPVKFNEIVCIGAGLSGIALGIRLKKRLGFTDIHFYDRNSGPAGTWEANRYPGCSCDVPAVYYSFSFETNPYWTSLYPSNTEIREYVYNLADKYDLRSRMTLRTECETAKWNEDRKIWTVFLKDLETNHKYTHECRILFSAAGVLVDPVLPKIPGIDTFKGSMFHTAKWKEDMDLTGKNVVVVGNGSSATQTVPCLVPIAKSVTQCIRTPHWLLSRPNPKMSRLVQLALAYVPGLLFFIRCYIFWYAENQWRMFIMSRDGERQRKAAENESKEYIRTVAPKKYRDILIPEWPIACKRRVFDNDSGYVKSMSSPNFHLTKSPILEITPEGVRTEEKTYPADVIVFGTGFQTSTSLGALRIEGRNGLLLSDHWKELGGPGAYNNTAIHGFPNFLLIFGPNSVTGHNSVIFAIESHVRYALKIIAPVLKGKAKAFEVDDKVEREYVRTVQEVSKGRVWNFCNNWYVSDGWNPTLYPWTQLRFWWKSHFPVWKHWKYTA